jgi:glycosyltransferase involved in cell wall biosynthesis
MKPPDHPTPSGDRLIARNFVALLTRMGFSVEQASRLSTRCRAPEDLPGAVEAAEAEVQRIVAAERTRDDRPALVFAYHCYHRAPDLIGPRIAAALAAPYVVAEASRAPSRAAGPWAAGHALSEAAIEAARLVITPTRHDEIMLRRLKPVGQHLLRLPPFIDGAGHPAPVEARRADGPPALLAAAMMRHGPKRDSYLALARILKQLDIHHPAPDWSLSIAGDGPARAEVEGAFAPLGGKVRFLGALEGPALQEAYDRADLFVWPAIEEPIGMVFVEAAAHGLASIAFGFRGVPDVIEHGVSGFIVLPADEDLFVGTLARLVADPAERRRLGGQARRRFEECHGMDAAEPRLRDAFVKAGLPLPASVP